LSSATIGILNAVRLNLRRKITGGFGLLIALIILLGWVTLSLFGSTRSLQRKVFDEAIPGLVAVDEIVRSYTAQSAAVRGFLIQSNQEPSLLEQYRAEVGTARFWENEARRLFTDPREEDLLEQLTDAGRRFHALVDREVIPLREAGDRSLAIELLSREGTPLISEIETVGKTLRDVQRDALVASENEVRTASNQTVIILLLVTAGVLAIGIAVAWLLPQRLEMNLSRLVEAARAIGRGDLNQDVQINSGDEVEELAERFTEMQSGLKRLQQLALQDRELEIAATIQRNLLQRSLPETPGLRVTPVQRQANLVGGDWYDVDLSGGSVTIAVGDASGKGIAAALMATVVLSVLRAERRTGSPSKRVVTRVNEALREATDPGSFTTLVYATVDVATGKVSWLNMGHPAPFLLRGRSARRRGARGYFLEGPRNRAIGWFESPGLNETVVQLEPGDRVIFFTDGFLEAKSPEGEVFGESRFAEAMVRFAPLAAEGLVDGMVEEVERFAAGKLDDDLTMLVVEFQGAALREAVTEELTGEEPWHSRR
jgi:serine phosphatase RsbU (regulator of sigma subunit)/CHASE3 domain sensor protein